MKPCKACLREIPDKAYKCSYCAAFQNWYRDPRYLNWLYFIPIFGMLFWMDRSFDSKEFSEYKNQFSIEQVKVVASKNKELHAITYMVKNNTDYKWDTLKYEMIGTDRKGELVFSEVDTKYGWVIQPKSESLLTVVVEKKWNVKSWSTKIVDLDTSRF